MGPEALAQVLRPLSGFAHPDLIVGLQTSDDAAVFRVSADLAVIQTIDFFTPVVDDAYTYGVIAAANSMSDVYAMGGDVSFALNVACFPETLPPSILSDILRGGADKVTEAGGVIAGGHTVTDTEPKYGLSVTGFVHPERIWRKAGAQPGDALFLTKPIGTGVISTALKNDDVDRGHLQAAVESMSTLNRWASELARRFPVSSCTDITGFGLLGHAQEVAAASDAQLRVSASSVPLLPGAENYATAGRVPGGLRRNRRYYLNHGVSLAEQLSPAMSDLLFDPQTSGGLLFTIPSASAGEAVTAFSDADVPLWRIGSVEPGYGVVVDA